MSLNMILVVFVIPCILSYEFNKFTILYIHVHISLISNPFRAGTVFIRQNLTSGEPPQEDDMTLLKDTVFEIRALVV